MTFGSFSPTAMWGAATRTLTGLGTSALAITSLVNQSLAANATASFAPGAATRVAFTSIGAVADASGSVVIQLTDGTNTWTAVTIAAGTTGGADGMYCTSTVAEQIHNNSATVAAHYFASGGTFNQ